MCGDVHGQFYDLLRIWELNGLPSPENPYLFNGKGQQTYDLQRVRFVSKEQPSRHPRAASPGGTEHVLVVSCSACTVRAIRCTGDFVDRGSFSVEVILALLAYKVS